LDFHAKMGYTEVGEQVIRNGAVKISQQVKEI
jgi:predicted GNAT superfamily acetyltransferase